MSVRLTAPREEGILPLMGATKAWTDARRRIVSKTLFDLFKIEVAASFASKLFAEFAMPIKLVVIGVMLLTVVVAFVLYPKED